MRYKYVFSLACIILSGCSRYFSWGKKTFSQVGTYSSLRNALAPHMRSAYEYDMLQTIIRADVLWVNDAVRTIHAQAVAQRQMGDVQDSDDVAVGTTTLYVFIAPQSDTYPPLSLCEQALWTAHLRVQDTWYKPTCIAALELDQEYAMLVGSAYNRYRMAYKVVFPVAVTDEDTIELKLLSSLYEVRFLFKKD